MGGGNAQCKGTCIRWKAKFRGFGGHTRYVIGQRRCGECELFMWCNLLNCPCCNRQLNQVPKAKPNRERLREEKQLLKQMEIQVVI